MTGPSKMTPASSNVPDLSSDAEIDLATVELSYQQFRALAQNKHLSPNERIGFPDSYREGFKHKIFADILSKLPILAETTGQTILDIGPGCAELPHLLIDLCVQREHRLVLVDSEEMLSQLPPGGSGTIKVPGRFPDNFAAVQAAVGDGGASAILCYSVLHYVYVDTNLFTFIDSTVDLLSDGGRALIGDIPNFSKRNRFFASPTGQAFHRRFMKTEAAPEVNFNELHAGKIDDAVLFGIIQRAQASGCDAYLLPQGADLPMSNRRDDLLIAKP